MAFRRGSDLSFICIANFSCSIWTLTIVELEFCSALLKAVTLQLGTNVRLFQGLIARGLKGYRESVLHLDIARV
jgi:hypothetical protein